MEKMEDQEEVLVVVTVERCLLEALQSIRMHCQISRATHLEMLEATVLLQQQQEGVAEGHLLVETTQ